MALILCLETATEMCSVALFRDEILLAIKESSTRNVHSSMLTLFTESVIKESGTHLNDLDAIAVSMGPGSYTGLRIGVATAKGLCYALDKPLIAVPTLQAMAAGINYDLKIKNYNPAEPSGSTNDNRISDFRFQISDFRFQISDSASPISDFRFQISDSGGVPSGGQSMLICPMIDARRMEVYCGIYDAGGREVEPVRAEIVDGSSFAGLLAHTVIVFGGEGAEKCKQHLDTHANARFVDNFSASAKHMNYLAFQKFNQQDFENLAYFEPYYLKDFVAAKARVKGLD